MAELSVMAPPPRRVPPPLWVRIRLGGTIAQGGWLGLALIAWLAAVVQLNRPAQPVADDISLWWLAPVALLVSVPILGIAAFRARRQLHLLRHGVATDATLVEKKEVSNSETSYWHYTFDYTIADGTTRRSTVITDVAEPSLENDPHEVLLYDPDKPDTATTLDHLPSAPAIRDGQLVVLKSAARAPTR